MSNPGSRGGRDLFKVNAITAGCLVVMLASAGAVQAQQQLDTVVVTGIRKGIEDAISVKKNKDNIVEAISAEDIGKLPDSSIAESIARLPGVSAQRVAGRASNISIRGMSGDFSTALLNGREQVSTGDNRGVEFDQYPSELLSGVVIYKTPDGELIGQGLSGTVDLQTVRPLNFKSRFIGANVRREKSGVGTEFEGSGSRMNFSYIDQFANRTVGVAFGAARLKSDVTTGRKETYDVNSTVKFDRTSGQICADWRSASDCAGFLGLPNTTTFEQVTFNKGFKYFNDSTEQTRDGVMGVLEVKPNKSFHAVLDLYYSKFERETVKRGLEIQVEDTWRGSASDPRYPGWINPVIQNGRLTSATWTNVNPLSRTIWEPRDDTLRSTGLNMKFGDGSGWTLTTDLSYSAAKRDERIIEMEAGIPTPGTVTVSNYDQITGLGFNYGDASRVKLMDPEGWGQNGYDKTIVTDDKIQALRLTAGRDLEGFFNRVNFGVNQTTRTKDKSATEYFLRFADGADKTRDLPAGSSSVSVGGTGGQFNAISFNPSAVYPSYYQLQPNIYADVLLKGWRIKEEITTGFLKAGIDSEAGGMPLRGNVGVQVVHTNQSATAPSVDLSNGSFRAVTDGKAYNDILPSANLILELGNDQTLRLGAARVLARSRLDQLSVGRRGEVTGANVWEGSGGNPKLDPFRATAIDLSYEKYWGTKAYVGAAFFDKQLSSYIFDFTDTNYDFSGFTNSSTRVPVSNRGKFTQPRNGKGGYVRGVELSASLPLDRLWSPLSGFGIVASYADTKSEIKPFGDSDTRPLPGLSRKVGNLTFYYEAHGFQARVSNRYRSDFLGEVQGFGANREYTFIRGESIIDAQVGYEFQSGFAKGLSVLLQVNNLNDEAFERYNGTTGNTIDRIKYGKTYLLGATYKL